MFITTFLKKERKIWHRRFGPSLIAGIAVAIITFFFEMTASNIVMFASLGASAAILTHKYIHKLTILRTVIFAYFIGLFVSLSFVYLTKSIALTFPVTALIVVTLTTLGLYLFNVFHPPAVSAALAFIMMENGGLREDLTIFFSVIILLILIKVLTYIFYYENLEMHKIKQEFKKVEKKEVKKIKRILK
jgi:CBS-domain-containing membrane protein